MHADSRAELLAELALANQEVMRLSEMLAVLLAMESLEKANLDQLRAEWSAATARCRDLHSALTKLDEDPKPR